MSKILDHLIKAIVHEKIELIQLFIITNIVEKAFDFNLKELEKYKSEQKYQDYGTGHLFSLSLISLG